MRRFRQILAGVASILEIQPAPQRRRRRFSEKAGVDLHRLRTPDADVTALQRDWAQIGKDLQHAVRRHAEEQRRSHGDPA